MPSIPDEPADLDPSDLVEEVEPEGGEWEEAQTLKQHGKGGKKTRLPTPKSAAPARAAPAPFTARPPPSRVPPAVTVPKNAAFDAETMVREVRRRSEAAIQAGDRVGLSRARTELALVLEVVAGDKGAALAEYRAAHASAPTALAPIAGARRLTSLRPVAPALALVESELRAVVDERDRAARTFELARLLVAGGSAPDKARAAYREILTIDPTHAGALRGLEASLRSQTTRDVDGTSADALAVHLEAMANAFAADPRLVAWIHVERAQLLDRLGRNDAARASFEAALALDAWPGPVRDAYTRHVATHQDAEALIKAYAAEAEIEPHGPRAARLEYAAARLASERLDDPARALLLYQRASAHPDVDEVTLFASLRELVRLYETKADFASAAEVRRRLLSLSRDPDQKGHELKKLAETFDLLARYDEAARYAAEALDLSPTDATLRELLDQALSKQKRHEQRVSMWTAEASRLTSAQARGEALMRAARIAEQDLWRPDLALTELRAAWAVDPSNAEVADGIARLLTPTTPPSVADPDDPSRVRARIDFFSEAALAASDPARKVAYLEKLAQIWEDEVRDPTRALEVYRDILVVEAGRRGAVLGLGRNAGRAGDARELFRALVLEADQAKDAAVERTILLRAADIASERLNDADAALALVARILDKNPGDAQALRAAFRTHERTGHYEEALAQLRLILQHTRRGTPALSVAIDIAVLLEQRLRRPAEALAAYREAHRADPAHPVPLQEIRRLLLVTGDHRALAEELVGLAGSAPVPAQKALLFAEAAEIYDDRLDELDRAIALLNQARTLLPNEEAILDRLERAFLRRGKVGDLVALLDARLASAPPGAKRRLKFFLASLLAEDRDLGRAVTLLTEIAEEEPQNRAALRLLEHTLRRTERWEELAGVLRREASSFEDTNARLGTLYEVSFLEEHRGVAPPKDQPHAGELIRQVAPDDLLVHEALLRSTGLFSPPPSALFSLTASLTILAGRSPDAHHAAALQLASALILERTSGEAAKDGRQGRLEALRRYRAALEGWPECLTAARGAHRLAEQLGDADALVAAAMALGSLETDSALRARHLSEAAQAIGGREASGVGVARASELLARALGEHPDSQASVEAMVALLDRGADPGLVADALRRALDRSQNMDQVVRLGAALAAVAKDKLRDPTVAMEALRRVRKKAPGHVPSLLLLAETCGGLALWSDAVEAAANALALGRDKGERLRATLLLAEAHVQVPGSEADATREARDAETLAQALPAEDRSPFLSRVANVYRSAGDSKSADRVLLLAVVFGGKDVVLLDRLSQSFDLDTEDGARGYADALSAVLAEAGKQKIVRHPAWIAALGHVEATRLARPREGFEKIREAIRLDHTRTATHQVLADAHAVLGSHDEAVNELRGLLLGLPPQEVTAEYAAGVAALIAREAKAGARAAQAIAAEELVAYLGFGSRDRATALRARRPPPLAPTAGSLGRSLLATNVLPEEARGTWLEASAVLLELVPKLLRVDAAVLANKDRLLGPRALHPQRVLCDRIAQGFGAPAFDLLVDAAQLSAPRLLPGEPPVLALPRGFGDLSENEQIVGIARFVAALTLQAPWLEEMTGDDLDGMLDGALRAGRENFGQRVFSSTREANAELWRPRIAKAASRKQRRALEEIADRARPERDPESWRQAMRLGCFRAAYLMTGDLMSTLDHVFRIDRALAVRPREQLARAMFEHPVTRDLIFYALSPEPLALRKAVGTG